MHTKVAELGSSCVVSRSLGQVYILLTTTYKASYQVSRCLVLELIWTLIKIRFLLSFVNIRLPRLSAKNSCCRTKGSLFIIRRERIHKAIYTTWSPSWLEINLVLPIHRAGIISGVAASFLSSKCLVSQHQWLLDFDVLELDGAYTVYPPRVIHSKFRPWLRGRHHFLPLGSLWSRRTSGPTQSAPIQKPCAFVRSFGQTAMIPWSQPPIAGSLIASHLMCGCYISAWAEVVIFLEWE